MSEPRLYLLTPPLSGPSTFGDDLAAALDAAPVACVRLRMAGGDEDALRRTADQLREIAHTRDVAIVLYTPHVKRRLQSHLKSIRHLDVGPVIATESLSQLRDRVMAG